MSTTDSTNLTMESLRLPQELYWTGKTEPASPQSSELFPTSEHIGSWPYDDNFANEFTVIYLDNKMLKPVLEEPVNVEDLVVELSDLKEEHWNEAKSQSPHLLDCPIGAVISNPNPITKVPFDSDVFRPSNIDIAILTQLTPPHSPPQNGAPAAFQTAPHDSQTNFNDVFQQSPSHPLTVPAPEHANASPAVQSFPLSSWNFNHDDDIVRETQIVDEILKSRANELWNDDSESQSSCSPPSQDDSITDEDWAPSCSSTSSSPVCCTGEEAIPGGSASTPKKRTRPYGRGVEDRKIRKKEQNKNAATRYRHKKKLEMETVQSAENELSDKHQELTRTLADLRREAKYLKTLIREFYQKK